MLMTMLIADIQVPILDIQLLGQHRAFFIEHIANPDSAAFRGKKPRFRGALTA